MNILITGANRGLGYEMTSEALERGHSVIAGVRKPNERNEKLSLLATAYKGQLEIVQLDVADEESIAAAASRMKQLGGSLSAIVNNAAILVGRDSSIEELDMADMIDTLEINLLGPMRVVKHFLPLLTDKAASIINISSDAGSITNAYAGDYPYAISKSALNMFSKQLHAYVQERGIQVLSIHPGWIRTDMGGASAPNDPRNSAFGILDLMERKIVTNNPFRFVDHAGHTMPI
jgi:NAD(P)-dependent dehydrogenase (short-subunit alcohol dehydrogenase family)